MGAAAEAVEAAAAGLRRSAEVAVAGLRRRLLAGQPDMAAAGEAGLR